MHVYRYHLERLIFYQLSELKRLQIRAGKSDERVMVKRLVEEYGRTGVFIGLKRYDGPFSFKKFEKYLYGKFFRFRLGKWFDYNLRFLKNIFSS